MARNARLLAVALATVLGAAVLASAVSAQASPKDSLLIEHWNGKAWTVTQAPAPVGGSELSAVTAISPTNVWAVGSSVDTTGTTLTWHPLAEHYDGISWSPVVLPTPNEKAQSGLVAVSGSSDTDVWAVGSIGHTLIEHYDGTGWTVVPSLRAPGSKLTGVAAISPQDAWAVGSTGTNTGKTRSLIEHWNGSAWRQVPSPDPAGPKDELLSISAWSARNIWAVGDSRFHGHMRTFTIRWNGVRWKNVWNPSSPSRQSSLRAVTVLGPTHAWAVGSSSKAGAHQPLAENFAICTWRDSLVRSPSDGVVDLYALSVLPSDDGWAVGSIGDAPKTLAERWDGSQWHFKATPELQTPAVLRGVAAVSGHDVWAVGSSTAP